ncbi:hypothetical protein B0H11DRAFT_1937666 [Mycena galericulata]|nr:hypothetical protein B0H11DRAFT_1937666 [Mycena galericulata]
MFTPDSISTKICLVPRQERTRWADATDCTGSLKETSAGNDEHSICIGGDAEIRTSVTRAARRGRTCNGKGRQGKPREGWTAPEMKMSQFAPATSSTRPDVAWHLPPSAGIRGYPRKTLACIATGSRPPWLFPSSQEGRRLSNIRSSDRPDSAWPQRQTILYQVRRRSVNISFARTKYYCSTAWFAIENSIIIPLAHEGGLEAAYVHRHMDDTLNGLALLQESQVHRVVPNQYLYNNIISKLVKTRKADYALELFEQMKAGGMAKLSSITYGAVIGASEPRGCIVFGSALRIYMKFGNFG